MFTQIFPLIKREKPVSLFIFRFSPAQQWVHNSLVWCYLPDIEVVLFKFFSLFLFFVFPPLFLLFVMGNDKANAGNNDPGPSPNLVKNTVEAGTGERNPEHNPPGKEAPIPPQHRHQHCLKSNWIFVQFRSTLKKVQELEQSTHRTFSRKICTFTGKYVRS